MRFVKRVIFGTITGLLVFYIIKSIKRHNSQKQESEEYLASEGASDFGNAVDAVASPIATDDTLAQSVENKPDSSEAEKESASPDSVFIQEGTKALVLSSIPHTPSLFQETDAPEQSAGRILEAEDDFTVDAQDTGGSENSPIVRLFDIPSEIEPLLHPGHKVLTGEYYPPVNTPLPKAKVRCRDNGGEWSLFLEMPEEREVAEAFHDGEELALGKEVKTLRFTGQVIVNYKDGGQETVNLYDSSPLYFRTDDEWEQDGTLDGKHSNGYFIVIAPAEMDDSFSNSEHDYEDCTDSRFHAHFLANGMEDDSELRGQYPITLTGNLLHDNAKPDSHGDLYVGQPPELSVHEKVTNARIVEETGSLGENRWGVNFDPHTQTIASVLNGRDGRFTIRTYLKNSNVRHESKTFRYFESLDSVEIDGQIYNSDTMLAPDNNGRYWTAALRFNSRDGFIKPVKVDNPLVFISEDGLLRLPPDPSIKSVICEFANRAAIIIDIPRVWWRLTDDESSNAWNDVQMLTPDDFVRIARRNVCIEMLLPQSVDTINVGFDNRQEHRERTVQDTATIRLRDFADHAALENIRPEETIHLTARINELELRLLSVFLEPCERHHWVLEEPKYNFIYPTGDSKGECKVCGAVGEFPNVSDMVKEQREARRGKRLHNRWRR